MAITLLEAAKLETDVLRKNVIEVFPAVSPILEALPFIEVPGGVYRYNTESVLPGIAFRQLNEDYTESTGVLQTHLETTKIFGGKAQVDRALTFERNESLGELRATHDRMKAKAAALFFTEMFFDGDSTSDARQFDGLNKRLTGTQVLKAGVDGAALSTAMLDDLIDAVAGAPDMLVMSKAMRRELNKLLREDGRLSYGTDAFGRSVTTYGGVPIRLIEENALGATILGFDETCGTAHDTGSIYALRFGADEYLSGIQNGPMSVLDMGLQSDLRYLTVIEWLASFVILHPRSAARLAGVKASL